MSAALGIKRGFSVASDEWDAAREFHAAVAQPDGAGFVAFFCSTAFDLVRLAQALSELFCKAHVIGCTTAGEIGPPGYLDGAITGFSLPSSGLRSASVLIPALSQFQMSRGHEAAEAVLHGFASKAGEITPDNTFAILLSDGMSVNEEPLIVSLQARIGNIRLLGGSAADNLNMNRTFIFHEGRFHDDAALLTLVQTPYKFRVYRWQHFSGSDTKMVVTAADPAKRTVTEINAEPAAAEYARLAGLDVAELTPLSFAEHPVMVRIGGDWYVRSISKTSPDGSLSFFCAIDEGVVLTLARREDIAANLAALFDTVRAEMGAPQLVIGFDCVLRRLEAENRQLTRDLSRILSANNVIGFCTYGEQFGAMHVNQTFTALAFGQRP